MHGTLAQTKTKLTKLQIVKRRNIHTSAAKTLHKKHNGLM
jgi:hypothetical protein